MPIQSRAARFSEFGAPEVIRVETIEVPDPGPGEVLVRHTVSGLNYQDTYHRSGAYAVPLPSGLGTEAAAVVERLGPKVRGLKRGDRVCYAGGMPGSYSQYRIFPAERLVKIPAGISDEQAAAVLLKGMTVEYLFERCAPVKKGQMALFWAAAGGVGLLAGAWARHRGVRLIGVAAGDEKCALAKKHGYFKVIDRKREDVLARVKEITRGAGVPAVFDSAGQATFETSLNALAPRGMFVSFGATTGKLPPIDAGTLQKHGSLYFTRPTLVTYVAKRAELEASAKAVFDLVKKRVIKVEIGQRYALDDVVQAHRDLEAGRTRGSTLITP